MRLITYPIWTAAIIGPLNNTNWIVEVVTTIRHTRIAPNAEISSATASTDVFVPCSSHMIDDCVNIDPAQNFRVQISLKSIFQTETNATESI